MEFLPPPMGEGSSYEVSFKDLRPSLDWSPKDGWRVPASMVGFFSPMTLYPFSLYFFSRLVFPICLSALLKFVLFV